MNCGLQICLFLLGTVPPSMSGSLSSSIRSTLSSSLSSSTSTRPGAGHNAGAPANAAANAAAAAAAGAPFLSLRGGSFTDGTSSGPPTGFNTGLIGVYSGQPQLSSSSPTPPLPLPPAYTAGNYPTPWSDIPNVYPAFNGYQQLESPGLSNYAYGIPNIGLSSGPGSTPLNLPSFGTTDRSAPPGASFSTGATPGVSSYLVQSINGYSTSSDLNGYPGGTRVQTFSGYVNAPDGSLPRYIYGQV